MQHIASGGRRREFELLIATRNAQAALMNLRPGGASDDEPSNEHPRCEQWLFVVSGVGEAIVGRRRGALRRVRLRKDSLLVIERGELHQIKNTGRTALRTVNLYVPPAYEKDLSPRRSARRA